MLLRAASLLIVVFWLTMTALLVRNEIAPDGSRIREVPVSHVLKLLFLPERATERAPGLNVTSEGTPIGHLNLRPHVDPQTEMHILDFDSALQVHLGINSRQRIKFDGQLQLDPVFAFHKLSFGLTLFDPSPLRTEVTVDPAANRVHVALSSQTRIGVPWVSIDERDYAMSEAGARELFRQMEVDPMLLNSIGAAQSAPALHARLSSLVLHGERVDTFLLTVEQNGQTLAEIHVSQLGNILKARTLLGYDFAPDDVTP